LARMNPRIREQYERQQIQQLNVADRMLLCGIYVAIERISKLEARRKRKGCMSDLLLKPGRGNGQASS
jgi:hypothetical protein